MKKFRFTLQSVLRLKESLEEHEKHGLYRLRAALAALMEERQRWEAEFDEATAEKRKAGRAGTTTVRLLELSWFLQDREEKIKQKTQEIDQMLLQITEQTEIVKRISTEVKTLEKLKEKQWALYREKAAKEQDLLIEDFVAGRMALGKERERRDQGC